MPLNDIAKGTTQTLSGSIFKVLYSLFRGLTMNWSRAWIISAVVCLALDIIALINAEWSSDSSKRGSFKLLTKDTGVN